MDSEINFENLDKAIEQYVGEQLHRVPELDRVDGLIHIRFTGMVRWEWGEDKFFAIKEKLKAGYERPDLTLTIDRAREILMEAGF